MVPIRHYGVSIRVRNWECSWWAKRVNLQVWSTTRSWLPSTRSYYQPSAKGPRGVPQSLSATISATTQNEEIPPPVQSSWEQRPASIALKHTEPPLLSDRRSHTAPRNLININNPFVTSNEQRPGSLASIHTTQQAMCHEPSHRESLNNNKQESRSTGVRQDWSTPNARKVNMRDCYFCVDWMTALPSSWNANDRARRYLIATWMIHRVPKVTACATERMLLKNKPCRDVSHSWGFEYRQWCTAIHPMDKFRPVCRLYVYSILYARYSIREKLVCS